MPYANKGEDRRAQLLILTSTFVFQLTSLTGKTCLSLVHPRRQVLSWRGSFLLLQIRYFNHQLWTMTWCWINILHAVNTLLWVWRVVGSGDGAGQLPVPRRPITLAYGRAGACCAYHRCGTGGLFFILFFFISSILSSFLMPHLLGDGWTFWNIVVSAVITQR